MQTIEQFVADSLTLAAQGQGYAFDGPAYGFQCVDLADAWANNLGHPLPLVEGAKDFGYRDITGYTWVSYETGLSPLPGDIIIFGALIGPYGHVAVEVGPADAEGFVSIDQNWVNSSKTGSPPALVNHRYYGVLGWQRPNSLPSPAPQPIKKVIKSDMQQEEKSFNPGQEAKFLGRHNGPLADGQVVDTLVFVSSVRGGGSAHVFLNDAAGNELAHVAGPLAGDEKSFWWNTATGASDGATLVNGAGSLPTADFEIRVTVQAAQLEDVITASFVERPRA